MRTTTRASSTRLTGAIALALLIILEAACGGSEDLGSPPKAQLTLPNEVDVGTSVLLDASASADPDNDIAGYRFIIADGTHSIVTTDPKPSHTFAITGWIEVRLIVRDARGNTDATSTQISVHAP